MMTTPIDDRLRTHPEERFVSPQLQFDLKKIATTLLAEPITGPRKHRQETLYKHGQVTVALFHFEQGAGLSEHVAQGVVTVHVLEGRLKMTAQGTVHELPAGQLLVMAPGVRHDLVAEESTRMLLTVCLEESKAK